MQFSRVLVEEVLEKKKAIIFTNAEIDEIDPVLSIADLRSRSIICAPMIDRNGEPLGVIQVDTYDHRTSFTDFELELLAHIAGYAAPVFETFVLSEHKRRHGSKR